MNSVSADKSILKDVAENLNQSFATSAAQIKSKEKTEFMQDFENGETIEESQEFVLQHINKIWKK